MRRKLTRVARVAVVCLVALTVPVGFAVADDAPVTVEIYSTAQLQSGGSALVTITYSCLPGFGSGSTGAISGTLEQASGFGSAAATAICDDRYHTTTLAMSPGPFTPGEAAANVTVGTGVNEVGSAQAEVTIR